MFCPCYINVLYHVKSDNRINILIINLISQEYNVKINGMQSLSIIDCLLGLCTGNPKMGGMGRRSFEDINKVKRPSKSFSAKEKGDKSCSLPPSDNPC